MPVSIEASIAQNTPKSQRLDTTYNVMTPALLESTLEEDLWPVILANLGTRAKNVLKDMRIQDCISLARLNLDELREHANVGRKTFLQIKDAQSSIQTTLECREPDIAIKQIAIPTCSLLWVRFSTIFSEIIMPTIGLTIGDYISISEKDWDEIEGMGIAFRDDTWETWSNLTISVLAFRSIPVYLISEITTLLTLPFNEDKYHEVSYIPIINIERVILKWVVFPCLSRQRLHILAMGGYASISDMNGLSERQLLQKHGLNLFSIILIAIFYSVADLIEDQMISASKYRSLDISARCKDLYELISEIMNINGKNARVADVFYRRCLHNKYKEYTLSALAVIHGITRERIRQIELQAKDVYSRPDFSTYIFSLLDAAQAQLSKEPVQSIINFAEAICREIGYTVKDDHHGYAVLASLIDGVQHDALLGYIFIYSYPCAKCEKLGEYIKHLFEEPSLVIPILKLNEDAIEFCKTENCKSSLSLSALKYIIAKIPLLEVESEEVRTLERYRSNRKVIDHVIEKICLKCNSSIHFLKIAEIIKEDYPQITINSDRMVHIWATKNRRLLLWDRGSFIHKNHVHINQQKLEKVYKWLETRLKKYRVQFIYGAYGHFHEELKKIGIFSETALYSSLRICKYPDLILPKYPHIYARNTYEGRLSTVAILEDYLEEFGEPASIHKLKQYSIGGLGMKNFTLSQSLVRSNFILRTSYSEYIHSKYVEVTRESIASIIEYVKSQAEKHGPISIDSVFLNKQVTCKMLHINSGMMLYSIIDSLAVESISMSGYPTITVPTKTKEMAVGIVDRIVEYIKGKNGSCLLEEIEDHFCKKLGYKHQYIGLARRKDSILRYSSSSLVHVDNILYSVDLEKIIQFSIEKFDSISHGRGGWGRIEDLIGIGLPDIDNGLTWTGTLLASILERSKDVNILGTNRKIYTVRDEKGVWRSSLGSIIFEILEEKYGGATSIQVIENELITIGIIANRLTSTMISVCDEVAMIGDTIMVSGIVENVTRY